MQQAHWRLAGSRQRGLGPGCKSMSLFLRYLRRRPCGRPDMWSLALGYHVHSAELRRASRDAARNIHLPEFSVIWSHQDRGTWGIADQPELWKTIILNGYLESAFLDDAPSTMLVMLLAVMKSMSALDTSTSSRTTSFTLTCKSRYNVIIHEL